MKTTLTLVAIGAAAGAAFLISCATIDRVVVAPPLIPGAKYVGMETCAACHAKEFKDFGRPAQGRVQLRSLDGEDEEVTQLSCEACHGPGSLHSEAGGGKGVHIINSGKDPEACFQCHLEMKAQFSLQHRHPVKEGRMSCNDCHNPHGDDALKPKDLWVGRNNETCAQCHRDQARPRVFEHEALREGCQTCHNPHGSINEKHLVERDNNLCLKCHAQIASPTAAAGSVVIGKRDHTAFLRQGTCWSAGCHTAIHGSDVNPHLRY